MSGDNEDDMRASINTMAGQVTQLAAQIEKRRLDHDNRRQQLEMNKVRITSLHSEIGKLQTAVQNPGAWTPLQCFTTNSPAAEQRAAAIAQIQEKRAQIAELQAGANGKASNVSLS